MKNINEIVDTYKKEQKNLTKTKKYVELEEKEQKISSSEIDIKRQMLHIEKLKEEREQYKNSMALDDMFINDEYNEKIKNEEVKLEEQRANLENLKKERKELVLKKDKTNEKVKKKILQKMNENQEKLRKDLTAEQKKLEIEAKKLKIQYDMKMLEIHEFKYQYDEQGVPTNGEEYRKMNEEALKIYDDMKNYEKGIVLCKKELEKNREVISNIPNLSEYEMYDESVVEKKAEKENKEEKEDKKDKEPTTSKNKEIEDKIEKIKQEMNEDNRNYKNIHLAAGSQVEKENVNKVRTPNKNTFEVENAIKDVYQQMQNDNKDVRNISFKAQPTIESNYIKYIEILEREGKIIYNLGKDEEEYNITIGEALENKKEKFKRLEISKLCREIAGGMVKGTLLKRKINPEIVAVLENNPKQLKEYITSINENKNLPFELVHNLENTNIFTKIKLNRFVKAEEKAGAWISGKLFDKNTTIIAKEKAKAIAGSAKESAKDFSKEKYEKVKSKTASFVEKIPNRDSKIEENARVALAQKEGEKELANNVKEIMEEQETIEK